MSDTGLLVVAGFGDADVTATFQTVHSTAHVTVPKPPAPVARLDVTIDSYGSSTAISAASNITFDMSGSTGFGLRHDLTFGDGSPPADAPTAKHVYVTPDYGTTYTARATVTDMLGRSDSVTQSIHVVSLPALNLMFFWENVSRSRGFRILSQDGRNVRGFLFGFPGQQTNVLVGTLDVGGDLHLALEDGSIAFDGPVILKSGAQSRMLLKVRGGTYDGQTLEFRLADNH